MARSATHLEVTAGVDRLLDIESRQRDGAATITLRGELDVYTAPRFREHVTAMLREGHTRIVVDAVGLEFLDSTGIRVLVAARRHAEAAGGQLRIVNCSAATRRIFELVGLDFALVD
jgi:anti-sigma B factor antagonist